MRRLSGLIKYLPQDNSPKLMCWACSCSYKRALAKTKHSDPARSGILVILVFVICFVLFWRFRLLCCDSILVDNIFLSQALNCFHKREKEKVSRWRKKGERTPKREVSAYDRYVYQENARILFTQNNFSILCWIHWFMSKWSDSASSQATFNTKYDCRYMHSKMPKRPDVTQQELPNPGLTLPPNKVAIASNIVVTLTITTTIIIIIDKDNDNNKEKSMKDE